MSHIHKDHAISLDHILKALNGPKPGVDSHMKMASIRSDRFKQYYQPSDNAHDAAVGLLLVPKGDYWSVLFMKRASHESDKHSGQISFPGGRKERTDRSLLDCALREIEEEIGLERKYIKLLGELTPLYVFASNHMVYTYVGYTEALDQLVPNEEVAEIILGPIDDILRHGVHKIDMEIEGTILKNVPYYNLNGEVLWGATAMIFTELLDIIKDIGNQR